MKKIILSCLVAAAVAAVFTSCSKEKVPAIPVKGITFSQDSLTLLVGEFSDALVYTLTPSNATNKIVRFSSSDKSIATVNAYGNVGGVSAGDAVITITTDDGGHEAQCTVRVMDFPQPQAIDLGLSVKWASFNVGAAKPEEYGNLYQWGGINKVTKGNYSNWPYMTEPKGNVSKYCKYVPSNMSKYWLSPSSTVPDNKTVLDPQDDVAHVKLGDKWRIPTVEECEELADNCTPSAATLNGVAGCTLTSKKNGNSIFLPFAGHFYEGSDTGRNWVDSRGEYWSSTLLVSLYTPHDAYSFVVGVSDSDGSLVGWADVSGGQRSAGYSVRPVCE